MKDSEIAKYLDYTNLSNKTTRDQIDKMVEECITYSFAGLCIAPCWTNYAISRLERLGNRETKVMTVPNWFMGGGLEQMEGITDSCCEICSEIDYIWNTYEFGELKDFDRTKKELKKVREMTKGTLKIIIEAYYLRVSDEKIHKQGMKRVIKNACDLVNKSGADYIKTDSGLFKRPDFDSLVEDCKLMVKYSKNGVKVKAAGGINNLFQAKTLIDLGVERIGTSKAVEIVTSDV